MKTKKIVLKHQPKTVKLCDPSTSQKVLNIVKELKEKGYTFTKRKVIPPRTKYVVILDYFEII